MKKNLNKRHFEQVEANRVITQSLRKLGIPYVNMNILQAGLIVADNLGIKLDYKLTKLTKHRLAKSIVDKGFVLGGLPTPTRKFDPKPFDADHVGTSAPSQKHINAFYDSWEWKRLSYDVKIARGRKCECCGATAPDSKIVTDHVKPLRYFWHMRLLTTNLQVLCDDCNRGKGSRDETDWRAENVSVLIPKART